MILPYAIIQDNKIVNIVNIDSDNSELIAHLNAIYIPNDCATAIGCSYIDGVFEEIVDTTDQVIESITTLSFDEIELLLESIVNENSTQS